MTDPIFSFGLLADVQYADDETDIDLDRHYRASVAKLRAAVAAFNEHDLAFVAHLGDLVDHDLDNAEPILDIISGSKAPVYHVLGNHDFASTASPAATTDPAAVLKAYGMQGRFYRIDQPGWQFLVLDTNEVGVIEHPPGPLRQPRVRRCWRG